MQNYIVTFRAVDRYRSTATKMDTNLSSLGARFWRSVRNGTAGATLIAVGFVAGCGGGGGGGAAPSKDAGSDTSSGSAGSTGKGGNGGGGGTGGAGGSVKDAGAPDVFVAHQFVPGPYNRALVAGGASATSLLYQVVLTAGQSPGGGNTVKTSSNYRFVGGLIGSTQK
jgi:hypothetical protein